MNNESNDYSLLHNLLSIPKKNLEEKLKELEAQKLKRQKISDTILSNLLTNRRKLRSLEHQFRYSPSELLKQVSHLDLQIHRETISCFEDIGELTAKINNTAEEIALSSIKFSLLDDELS